MIDTVLFDLDGTLLPMDQDHFIKMYMGLLSRKLEQYGYEPRALVKAVWAGTEAMVRNDGALTNEEVFWRCFRQIFGPGVMKDMPLFEEFYASEFAGARSACGFNPKAAELIAWLKEKGVRLVLATNPLFPAIATRQRIRWAGLDPEDFELVTTYENSRRCKPNPDYYRDILETIGKDPGQCIMVGNDAGEDMVPGQMGMQVFLLTDCLINRAGIDVDSYPKGDFDGLKVFLEEKLK